MTLVEKAVTIADFASAVEPFGETVIQTDLNEDEVNALRKALNKAPALV